MDGSASVRSSITGTDEYPEPRRLRLVVREGEEEAPSGRTPSKPTIRSAPRVEAALRDAAVAWNGPGAADGGATPDDSQVAPDDPPAAPNDSAPRDLASLPDPERFRSVEAAPDPFQLSDVIGELEEAIVTLAGHVHAAKHRLLTYIAELDRLRGWKLGGYRDCADWLHARTGIRRKAAQEWVRTARALPLLPLSSAAMARGEISFSKMRALARAAPDLARSGNEGAEAELLHYARQCTTAEVEKLVQGWKLLGRLDEQERERQRHASRTLSIAPDGNGMYAVTGRLDPEVGALLMRAIEAASDALFREGEDWAPEGGERGPRAQEVEPRQRRADAIGLLAERAMAAGFGPTGGSAEREEEGSGGEAGARDETGQRNSPRGPEGTPAQKGESVEPSGRPLDSAEVETEPAGAGAKDTDASPCSCTSPPLSGTRAERYQVVIHVDEETLSAEGEGERSHLADGTRVSAETARRFACDGSVIRVLRGGDGSVLDVGRKTRTIPPALRRALEIRDGGCRFPGCGLRFTEGHHIISWLEGGPTCLDNLISLCRHHHRAVHEEGFRIRLLPDGRVRFFDRTGWPLPHLAPPPRLPRRPVEALLRDNRRRRVDPDGWSCSARYERDAPWEVEARALEALDPSG